MQDEEYEQKMLEAFVGKEDKFLWYQNAFSKFNINGVDAIKWHWSWWGLFGGFIFLLYRKAYLASLALFMASITIGMFFPFSLIIAVLAGGYSTYFIYKAYKSQKQTIEAVIEDKEKRIETMKELGGYHQWVVWVYGIFTFVVMAVITTMVLQLSH